MAQINPVHTSIQYKQRMSLNPDEHVGSFHISQLTPDVCIRLVQSNANLLERLPKHLRTEAVLIAAIKAKPTIIKSIHPSELTNEMCRIAIEKNNKLGMFASSEYITHLNYLELWKSGDIKLERLIYCTPNEHLPFIYSEVFKKDGNLFTNIPEQYRTIDMVNSLINLCISRIGSIPLVDLIPEKFLNDNMYKTLAEKNLIPFGKIPKHCLNEQIVQNFLKTSASCMASIPEIFITKENIILCLWHHSDAIRRIPEKYLTPELYSLFVLMHPSSIRMVPERFWTVSMVLQSCMLRSHHRLRLEEIPEHLRIDTVLSVILVRRI